MDADELLANSACILRYPLILNAIHDQHQISHSMSYLDSKALSTNMGAHVFYDSLCISRGFV
jgi:hypothetical protein